jgi:hypothetical protein
MVGAAMTSVPTIHRWLAGDEANAVRFNEIRDQINFLRNPPMAHVQQRVSTQTFNTPPVAWQTMTFDTLVNSYDPYDMWDPAAPDRLTITVPGWYNCEIAVSVVQTTFDGRAIMSIWKSGDGTILRYDQQNAGTDTMRQDVEIFFNEGDYIQLRVLFDDTGRTTNITSFAQSSQMRVRWVSQ